MLIDENTDRVRFTTPEMASVRKRAAANGFAINKVETMDDAMEATIKALPLYRVLDMLRYIESRIESSESTRWNTHGSRT